jgi:hypothetical protein
MALRARMSLVGSWAASGWGAGGRRGAPWRGAGRAPRWGRASGSVGPPGRRALGAGLGAAARASWGRVLAAPRRREAREGGERIGEREKLAGGDGGLGEASQGCARVEA